VQLKELILAKYSRSWMLKIVKWVGKSPARFDELTRLFLGNEQLVSQRAGWPLSTVAIKYPELAKKHIGKLINNLDKKDLHDAVKRNTVRILQFVEIPTRYHGKIMDTCFRYIQSPDEPIAAKAFSLTILENLLAFYPEIYNELKLIIEERWEQETAAFRSRARKILIRNKK
jgi:hypothetical protein